MTTALAIAALLLYLAGIAALATAMPNAIKDHPTAQHLADTNPTGVALLLALVTIAWPLTIPYALISNLAQRSNR
ncbi:hypothetical protein OOK48_35255 [Streptomyces viridodiastaticus]|uniref:hypothetical protein n=1 Tax=Streptomyces albogriseolus TaxID=1887 RepID=UPI002251E291|nr:hypothetical protein [Streptomyces viridodiastaticus]MCX4571581.1 hypothetical protein [Streptomyces viridodiastaticus]